METILIAEQQISWETLQKVKAKGFDWRLELCQYKGSRELVITQALVLQWFRDKHNIYININPYEDKDGRFNVVRFSYDIITFKTDNSFGISTTKMGFSLYGIAIEIAIVEALEFINN